MSKYLGIDYGAKRVGVAISDETGTLAFPRAVFLNDATLRGKILTLIEAEKIDGIVCGESIKEDGGENIIMKEARVFAEALRDLTNLPLYFEKEFFTSVEARRMQEHHEVDDSAAALILQRYLDKQK